VNIADPAVFGHGLSGDRATCSISSLTSTDRRLLQTPAANRRAPPAASHLSDATVKSHVARILAKLDLRDRVQIVVFAYESGIIRPGGAS
jgi:hypothetical protein